MSGRRAKQLVQPPAVAFRALRLFVPTDQQFHLGLAIFALKFVQGHVETHHKAG
jgi:hypothetical protein